MQQVAYTYMDVDRSGTPNSALNLNGSYTQVPPNVYFSSEFSITAWLYPNSVTPYSRLIDFGNGPNNNNIIFSISEGSTMQPYFHIYGYGQKTAGKALSLQIWSFICATFDGTTLIIYINGVNVGSTIISTQRTPSILSQNYIGKSNWAGDGYTSSLIDELRIYNRSLTLAEINQLMHL